MSHYLLDPVLPEEGLPEQSVCVFLGNVCWSELCFSCSHGTQSQVF